MPVFAKTQCQISRSEFAAKAKPLTAEINGQGRIVSTKEFSTGSLGWYENGKITVMIDGKPVACTMAIQITVIGSKELPQE